MDACRYQLITFDMDDTLFPEIAYVRSGYAAVARMISEAIGVPAERLFERMWHHFQSGDPRRVFDVLGQEFPLPAELGVSRLVELYRSHIPEIQMRPEAPEVLAALREAGVRLGVVTDGPSVQQRAKAQAIDLARYVDAIVFTGELPPGCGKPSPVAFERLMRQSGVTVGDQCMYVADNPRKDFAGPRQLGWFTLQFIQDDMVYCREAAPPGGEPHACIHDLREVLRHAGLRPQ